MLITEMRNANGGKWKDPKIPKRSDGPTEADMYHYVEVMLEFDAQWALPEHVLNDFLKRHQLQTPPLKIPPAIAREIVEAKRQGVFKGPAWTALGKIWERIEATARITNGQR